MWKAMDNIAHFINLKRGVELQAAIAQISIRGFPLQLRCHGELERGDLPLPCLDEMKENLPESAICLLSLLATHVPKQPPATRDRGDTQQQTGGDRFPLFENIRVAVESHFYRSAQTPKSQQK